MGIYDRDYMKAGWRPSRSASPRKPQSFDKRWFIAIGCFLLAALLFIDFDCTKDHSPALKLVNKVEHDLGQFEISSGSLLVSDPTYPDQPTYRGSLTAFLPHCLNGKWDAISIDKEFDDGVGYISELIATHESVGPIKPDHWKLHRTIIGVDSGTAGFFDPKSYQHPSSNPPDIKWNKDAPSPKDLWRIACWERTRTGAGCLPAGAVSRSGRGDGGYSLFFYKDPQGQVTAVRLVFIDDEGRG